MAPSNINLAEVPKKGFQAWVIEDSWEGAVCLEARLIKTWQGVCGSHRLLADREGRYYWWTVIASPLGRGALQKVVTFPDWESLAAEMGFQGASAREMESEAGAGVLH